DPVQVLNTPSDIADMMTQFLGIQDKGCWLELPILVMCPCVCGHLQMLQKKWREQSIDEGQVGISKATTDIARGTWKMPPVPLMDLDGTKGHVTQSGGVLASSHES
ncbi:hypothetical protein HispidOSU_013292, partial [Sigmodon hispidus]